MSSVTKHWTEEDFRRELLKIDDYVRKTQGIELVGGELDIEISEKACQTLGVYFSKSKKFRFSRTFFDSDVPEACAIDVIRHEYAHYYTEVVFGVVGGHGAKFKAACRIVGANPGTYYTKQFENTARKKEEWNAKVYKSKVKAGQKVCHPSFGKGTVKAVEPLKVSALLTIDFERCGVKVVDEVWLEKNGVLHDIMPF